MRQQQARRTDDDGGERARLWTWAEIGLIFGLSVAAPPLAMWLMGLM